MADDMSLRILLESQDNSEAGLMALQETISSIQKSVDDLTRAASQFAEQISKSMSGAADSVGRLEQPLGEATKEIEQIRKSAQESAGVFLTAFEDAQQGLLKDSYSAASTFVKDWEDAAQQAQKALDSVHPTGSGSSGGHGGSDAKGLAGLLTNEGSMNLMYAGMTMGGAALPIDAGFKSAIDTFTQFNQQMANVNSMMGLSQQQLAAMSQQVVELSKTVPEGPGALADALYGIVGAGVPASQAMDVLRTSAEAAAAGQTDLSTASGAIIAVMDSYGLSAKDAGKIADEMFAANQAGALTFQQLATSIGTVAGPAATAGVDFSQVAAATAALTNEGLSAQRSTMGLRALLMGIVSPTSGAQKEAHKLGIEWDQNALKQKGLVGMMQEAMKATGGNAQELKKLIPNIAAWTVAVDLGGKGAQSYKNAMDVMAKSTGATSQALQAQSQGVGFQMEEMKARIQTAQIAFVTGFAPVLSQIADDITKLAQAFANLSPHTQRLIAEIAGAAAIFLTVGAPILMFVSGIGQAYMGITTLTKAFREMAIVQGVVGFLKELANGFNLVGAAEAFMDAMNPATWIVLAIAAIGALAVVIYQHWGGILTFMQGVWNSIVSGLTAAWNFIVNLASAIWNGLLNFFRQWGTTLLAVFMPTLGIPVLIAQHWGQITQIAQQIWNSVTKAVTDIWNNFVAWITGAVQAFVNMVVGWFEWLYNHNYYFQALVDFIRKAWQTIQQDAQALWNAITQFLSNLWNTFINAAKALWNGIVTVFQTIWNTIKAVAEAFWNAELKSWSATWNAIVKAVSAIFTPILKFFSGIWEAISGTAQKVWGEIATTMSGLWNGIIQDAEKIFNGLGDFFSGLWRDAEQWGANLIHMFAQGVEQKAEEVWNAVKGIASKIAGVLGFHSPTEEGPASDSDTWAPNFVRMFAGGLIQGANTVATASQALVSPLSNAMSPKGLGALASSGSSLVAGMGGSAQAGGLVIQVYAQGNITKSEDELGKIVAKAIWDQAKRQSKF